MSDQTTAPAAAPAAADNAPAAPPRWMRDVQPDAAESQPAPEPAPRGRRTATALTDTPTNAIEASEEDVIEDGSRSVDVGEGDDSEEFADDDGEQQPERDTHRVKVDGEEFDVTTEELIAGYSRQRAATKRFQEAAALQKQVQSFVGALRAGDPTKIATLFSKIGVDFTKVAEAHLTSVLDELSLPETERSKRTLQREREELERQRREWEHQQREHQLEAQAAAEVQRMTSEANAAITAAGVKPSAPIIARVAQEMEQALTHGYDMTIQQAVSLVIEDLRAAARRLPREALERRTGSPESAAALKRSEAERVAGDQRRQAASVTRQPRQRQQQAVPQAVDPESPAALRRLFGS